MATKSQFEPFDVAVGDWGSYLTHFKFFLAASEIEGDEWQCATFLSSCGQPTFEVAQALVALASLKDTPFFTIKGKLQEHFTLKQSEIACCHMFYKRNQALAESISDYVAALC